jgi:uncharacterized SAM-binding protein YcdF (DUF218 family)
MKQIGTKKNKDRKTIPGLLLLILGAALLAYFGVWASGTVIHWSFDIGVFFILACGVLFSAFGLLLMQGGIVRWFRKHRLVKWVCIAAASLFFLSFAVVECMILGDAGLNDSKVKADFVLIPGASVVGDRPSLVLQHRLDAAIPYIRKNPQAIVIVSGSLDAGEALTEAEVMKRYLVGKGINAKKIVKEEKATDTVGNVAYSKKIIDSYNINDPKVMIVTNDYHMFRAMLLAKSQGLDAYGITRKIHWSVAPICYCREYFSVMKLFLTGLKAD